MYLGLGYVNGPVRDLASLSLYSNPFDSRIVSKQLMNNAIVIMTKNWLSNDKTGTVDYDS